MSDGKPDRSGARDGAAARRRPTVATGRSGRAPGDAIQDDAGAGGARVLLVSMPWAALDRPSLALGLLAPELERVGAHCDVRHLAFAFADYIGLETYQWVHREVPYTAFAGDWVFTQALYGDRPAVDRAYVDGVLRGTWQLTDADVDRLVRLRPYCGHFLDHCLDAIDWGGYDVVGFTSTFEQNIASLALARRVKERHPSVTTVFGGANWEGEMGVALHEQLDFVDVVCSGEADETLPRLVTALRRGDDLAAIRGLVLRRDGRTVSTGPAPLVSALDALPMPSFDPWFADLAASPSALDVTPTVLTETSRGCWWGAKHHCTFCGLNGGSMQFRSKSAERVMEELRFLHDRHGGESIALADNIMDMAYFRTLLPMLERERLPLSLFYEVKANLGHEQLRQLAAAGVRHLQPGIESFSDHVLELMSKGTTALQNVQLLKWCKELGIRPEWNLLYGFPGETAEDYERMTALIGAIGHLDPPVACGPVRLDRFSPYFERPEEHGVVGIRPLEPYRALYPFAPETLARVAYYFDFDYADGRQPLSYARPVIERIRHWTDAPQPALWLCPQDGGDVVIVRDLPAGSGRETLRLTGWQAAAYLACDAARSLPRIAQAPAVDHVAEDDVRAFLDGLAAQGLVLADGGRYLALAVHVPARTAPADAVARRPDAAVAAVA